MSLDDFAPSQIALMARLGAGFVREEAFGCEIAELSDIELVEAHSLVVLGLVEIMEGWRDTIWFVLTEKAFRLIEEGLTE